MKSKTKRLDEILSKYETGSILMRELPVEKYLKESIASLKHLTKKGFGGIYVSFQRPHNNIKRLLEDNGVDTKNIHFIDAVTPIDEHEGKEENCYHIGDDIEIDDLVKATHKLLSKVDTKDKFIFIDSITTVTLYKPLSEVMRYSWFLIDTVKGDESNIVLIFNVAKDLTQKRFIQDIALKIDETF